MKQLPRFVPQGEYNLVCKLRYSLMVWSKLLALGLEGLALLFRNFGSLVVILIILSSIGVTLRESASI